MKKFQLVTPDLTHQEFSLFQSFVEESSGFYVDESKHDILRTGLLARTTALNLSDYMEYYKFLKFNPRGEEEFKELLTLLTICETYFFRDIKHYNILKKRIFPQLVREKEASGDKGIRIWSAGCSTGEEPYTIAMSLLESFVISPEDKEWEIEIFASDVSTKAIEEAKRGIYSKWSMRAIPPLMIDKYFIVKDNKFHITDIIKNMVNFGYFNLIKEPYPLSKMGSYWDIIFCKNVTIYFKPQSTRRVIQNFYRSLRPNGHLFIGSSESLYHIDSSFNLIEIDKCFVYQKAADSIIKQKVSVEKVELLDRTTIDKEIKENKPLPVKKVISVDDIEKNYSRAEAYFQREEFDNALTELMKIVEQTDKHPETHLLIADIYANVGRYADAERECRYVLDLNSLLAPAHYLLGIMLQKKGEIEESIEEFKKTIFLEPYSPLAHLNLGNIYSEICNYSKSIKEYQTAIKLLQSDSSKTKFTGALSKEILIQTCQRNIERASKAAMVSKGR